MFLEIIKCRICKIAKLSEMSTMSKGKDFFNGEEPRNFLLACPRTFPTPKGMRKEVLLENLVARGEQNFHLPLNCIPAVVEMLSKRCFTALPIFTSKQIKLMVKLNEIERKNKNSHKI